MRPPIRFLSLVLLPALALATSAYAQSVEPDRDGLPAEDPQVSMPVDLNAASSRLAFPVRSGIPIPSQPMGEVFTSTTGSLAPALLPSPDPRIATRRAMFFPGGGHFYTGETMRGAVLLGVAAGSLAAGALLSSRGGSCQPTAPGDGCEYDPSTHEYRRGSSSRTPLYVGAAVAVGSWLYGIVDASSSAARVNARLAVSLGPVEVLPEPLVDVDREGRTELRMRLRLAH